MNTKAIPSQLCVNCNGRGYTPRPIMVEPGDLKLVNVWCETCHGQGVVPDEKLQPEKDRTKHVRWECE